MEIKRKMAISAEKCFDTITQSVLYDIKKETGQDLTGDDLTGFEYIKTFSKNSRAAIKIEVYQTNRSYHYRTKTDKNNFLVKYDIEPLSKNTCRLYYYEEVESYGHMQKLNDALVGTLLNRFRKKRFVHMLKTMEDS